MDTPPLHTHDAVPPEHWTFVVPVRDASTAKTRLVAPVGVDHAELVRAMALDVLGSVAATGATLVLVTDDPVLVTVGTDGCEGVEGTARIRVIRDPARGLSAAIETGLAEVERHAPAAVLLGDVPCLRTDDVIAALKATVAAAVEPPAPGAPAAFVRDAAGTGTTMLASTRRDRLRPRFGVGSAAAHAQVAVEIGTRLPRLRRDVDTASDLDDAIRLGAGPRTAQVLATGRPGGWLDRR